MTATTFTTLGSNSPASTGSTIVLTIGANVSIGDNVFVVGCSDGNTADTTVFTDSQGNSYLTDVQVSTTGRSAHGVGHTTATHAMTSGVDTITCTLAGVRSSRIICAWIETTPGATLPLAAGAGAPSDGASSAAYTVSPAGCGTHTPTSNPDLSIAVYSQASGGPATHGTPASFTNRFDLFDSTSLNVELEVFAITNLTTTNAALAPTMTMTGAVAGVGSQIIFKYQGNPTTSHQLGLTGVGA